MGKLNFREVALFVVEPNPQIRECIKEALLDLGFRLIKHFEKVSRLKEGIEAAMPDLIVADVGITDGDVCSMFYAIRHHQTGDNPFVPIISTSWSGTEQLLRKVIDSGADDLLIKPFSVGLLKERIERLVHFRKLFIVTSDYIGPDRHNMPRPQPEHLPLLKVPNTLQTKATSEGDVDPAELQKGIDYAVSVVNEHKMIRHAHQIVYLSDLIVPAFARKTANGSLENLIERLIYVTGDLARRMKETRFSHVSKLCGSLIKVTTAIHEKVDNPDSKDLKLLPELAQATQAAFTSDEKIISLVQDISVSVDRRSAG